MKSVLKGKNIVLGVSGGIAAYKSVELLRLLKKEGADVRVLMTDSATRFVGPLTFEALSGQTVCSNLFEEDHDASIGHIGWAEAADAVVVAPATANIIGKMAVGIADDALTTFILAVTAPVMICPSMNSDMYENKAVQRNMDTLASDGYHLLAPGSGELACGTTGPGRLPEPDEIIDRLKKLLLPEDMMGRKLLVTAGPTQEPMDPVRFVSNPSTGKMGYAIAKAAEQRGAEVVLVTGPTSLPVPLNIKTIQTRTAEEMAAAVFEHAGSSHVVIKSAAVSDYRPLDVSLQKMKKDKDEMTIALVKNPDILFELGREKKGRFLVGFAAETEDLEQFATRKLAEKKLDIIVGNVVGASDAGFGSDTNKVTLYYKDGTREPVPMMEKESVAHILLDRILERIEK